MPVNNDEVGSGYSVLCMVLRTPHSVKCAPSPKLELAPATMLHGVGLLPTLFRAETKGKGKSVPRDDMASYLRSKYLYAVVLTLYW